MLILSPTYSYISAESFKPHGLVAPLQLREQKRPPDFVHFLFMEVESRNLGDNIST